MLQSEHTLLNFIVGSLHVSYRGQVIEISNPAPGGLDMLYHNSMTIAAGDIGFHFFYNYRYIWTNTIIVIYISPSHHLSTSYYDLISSFLTLEEEFEVRLGQYLNILIN